MKKSIFVIFYLFLSQTSTFSLRWNASLLGCRRGRRQHGPVSVPKSRLAAEGPLRAAGRADAPLLARPAGSGHESDRLAGTHRLK